VIAVQLSFIVVFHELFNQPEYSSRLSVLNRGAKQYLRVNPDRKAVFFVGSILSPTTRYPNDIDVYLEGRFAFLPYQEENVLHKSLQSEAENATLPRVEVLGTIRPTSIRDGVALYDLGPTIKEPDFGIYVVSLYADVFYPPNNTDGEIIAIRITA